MLKLEIKFPQNGPTVPQYSLDVITAPFKCWEHLIFQVRIGIQLSVIQINAEEFLHHLNTPESGNIC